VFAAATQEGKGLLKKEDRDPVRPNGCSWAGNPQRTWLWEVDRRRGKEKRKLQPTNVDNLAAAATAEAGKCMTGFKREKNKIGARKGAEGGKRHKAI